ncbi:hypothetical protein LTR94_025692 [Friedmanniomyces endolithicus]|nr:hypothetical protein LTR94_025692 [Friedmanniomyces endolithicus]
MAMLDHDADSDNEGEAPLDMLEAYFTAHGWPCERHDDEMTASVKGSWTEYELRVLWREEDGVLQLLAFPDVKVAEKGRGKIYETLGLVNEQLWMGHFELWSSSGILLYRNATAIEARDGPGAEARLRPLLPVVRGDDRTRTLTLLGDALDRQGRTAEAFAAYDAAQANFRDVYRRVLAPGTDRPSHRAFIERIADQVAARGDVAPAPAARTAVEAAKRHVFLLGYPRSGTTLVENILASAAGVSALEERDTLAATDGVLLHDDGTLADLDAISEEQCEALRTAYWQRVRGYGASTAGTFVDMNPLGGARLPIIARLFPDARILVMRRDPRDVVLSCYRINFTPSPAAWCFSDLTEAARHYDALMRLTETCRAHLPLAFHEVRYDRLVTDFEATVRAMATFIDLPWTDDFLRFDRTAQRRGVGTASATQVRQGLFDGRGQWRRYAEQLAPALPILAPWVERYGFAD